MVAAAVLSRAIPIELLQAGSDEHLRSPSSIPLRIDAAGELSWNGDAGRRC